jgi:hypothetical protein
VIGSVGIDVQASRAAACLLEWPDQATGRGAARQGAIGDGRRLLIPVAATPDDAGEACWGSAAAEAVLSRVTADAASAAAGSAAMLAPALFAWRTDPWSEEFLGGLRQRLLRYLGLPQTGRVRGHQLSFCADPGSAGDWADAARALEDASLQDAEFLRPADALLCRWLVGDPDLSRSRTVLAVACGETATDLGLYTVEGSQDAVGRIDMTRIETGAAGWLAELAAEALGLCRPDTPARALLSLLDGADELAAALRAAPAEARVEWSGPLSQHMFEPYRASRAELSRHPAVSAWTMPVAEAARQLARGASGPVTVLAGGPGATWPFAADLLGVTLGVAARDGGVWGSGDPALDLAFGACWWPLFKRSFGGIPAMTRSVAPAAGQVVRQDAQQVLPPAQQALPDARATRQEAVPPWADEEADDRAPAAGQLPWADDEADDREPAAGQPPWAAVGVPPADEPPGLPASPPPWEVTPFAPPTTPGTAPAHDDDADLAPWER